MAVARGSKARPSAKKQRTSTKNTIAAMYAKAIPKFRRLKETQQARKISTLSSISLSSPAPQSSPKTAPAEKDFGPVVVDTMHTKPLEDTSVQFQHLGPAVVDTMHTNPLEDASVQFQHLPNPLLDIPAIPLEPMPYLDFDAVPTFPDPLADLNKAPPPYQQQPAFLKPYQFPGADADQFVVPDTVEHFPQVWTSPTLHESHQPLPQLPSPYQPLVPENTVSYQYKDDDGFFAMPQSDFVGLADPGLSWAQPDYMGDDFGFGMGAQSYGGSFLSVIE